MTEVSMQSWLMWALGLVVGGIVIPSGIWLVREVLALRLKLVTLDARIESMDKNCNRHQAWGETISGKLEKMNNNIVRLCENAGVKHES